MEKKITQEVQAEVAREVERLIGRVFPNGAPGSLDLEATEMRIRGAMHQVGGLLLGKLINADGGGHRGPRLPCGQGHPAEFVDDRTKEILTVLDWVQVRRAYYYCAACQGGVIPKDRELDIVHTSFRPGVRRLMGRVGGKEAFQEARRDLQELAGLEVNRKEVERVAEAIGQQIEAVAVREREAAWTGKLVAFSAVAPNKMSIAIDGTGAPMAPRETAGRAGKDETGQAKTREAKLGCIFTQTGLDEQGNPVRDPESTTYVAAIETAAAFGQRLYAEAVRRGLARTAPVIVLGDGAPWIWALADEHFPGAIQIVDLYHAREHLGAVGKLVYGLFSPAAKHWTAARSEELDAGEVERVVAALARLRPREERIKQEVRKAIGYFQTNAQRMRYAQFRSQGLFVGSGVVEAGCKTIIGRRLKQSGMRWTVPGANAIIALRCCDLSGRWESFWEARSVV